MYKVENIECKYNGCGNRFSSFCCDCINNKILKIENHYVRIMKHSDSKVCKECCNIIKYDDNHYVCELDREGTKPDNKICYSFEKIKIDV